MPRKRRGPPYRRVVVAFWNDPDVRRLGPIEQLFLLYLFTNEHSHPAGIYRIRATVILDEFHHARDREHVAELLAAVSRFSTYDRATGEVFVHRMAEYQLDGPLVGGDKRIRWVASHLSTVQSEGLLDAFRATYEGWAIPWEEVQPDRKRRRKTDPESPLFFALQGRTDATGVAENRRHGTPSEAGREGASQAPSQDPKATGFPHSNTPDAPDVEKEGSPLGSRIPTQEGKGHGMGHGKGHGMPDPDPDPEEKGYSTSYPSSRSQKGGEIENMLETGRRPKHPATDTLWRDRLRSAVFETWHHGREEIDLDETTIGIGREYWIVNELLNYTKDPDLVTWLVETAPLALGWADEPRSLYWLIRGENLGAATSAYFKRQDNGKRNARIDSREEERQVGDRKAELRRQLEEGRAHG